MSSEKFTTEISPVLAWHDALNSGDVESLLQVSSDDVDLAGPQGASQGTGVQITLPRRACAIVPELAAPRITRI